MNEKIKRSLRPVLQRMGLLRSYAREGLALQQARLATEVRLEAKGLRVALIGCGTMGRTIASAVKALPGASLPYLYDQRGEGMQRIRDEIHGDAYACQSVEELLRYSDSYDVVAIATTAQAHVPIALQALEQGVRKLLVEKPVATSLEDADRLIQSAEQSQALAAVDHTRRWIGSYKGLRRLLRSGAVGKPRGIHFFFGRGGLAMIGTHLVDLARLLFDDDLISVRAELDEVERPNWRGDEFRDPSGRLTAVFRQGTRVTIDLSDDLPMNQSYYIILGETGRIEVDERMALVRLAGAGGRTWEEPFVWPGGLTVGVGAALVELHAGRTPSCSLADGRAALEAVVAAHQSHRAGGSEIKLPLGAPALAERFPFA